MFLGFEFSGLLFLSALPQDKARSQFIWFLVFISIFYFFFFHFVKIQKLNFLFLFLKDDVAFLKCQIKYFIIILMLTLAFSVPTMHFVCHVDYFH